MRRSASNPPGWGERQCSADWALILRRDTMAAQSVSKRKGRTRVRAGRDPLPAGSAELGTVVPMTAARARQPVSSYCLARLLDVPVLVVRMDERVYLFPPDVLPLAPDLLSTDPASLARTGAGVDITMLYDPDLSEALAQAVLVTRARARRHKGGDGSSRPRRRNAGKTR